MIQKSQLEQMFAGMRKESKWNVDGDLLWGCFFTDEDPNKLRAAAKRLAELGYRVVDLSARENSPLFWLHVEKVETHSADSLHQRNQEFYRLAADFGLNSYDGIDVGPVPGK